MTPDLEKLTKRAVDRSTVSDHCPHTIAADQLRETIINFIMDEMTEISLEIQRSHFVAIMVASTAKKVPAVANVATFCNVATTYSFFFPRPLPQQHLVEWESIVAILTWSES